MKQKDDIMRKTQKIMLVSQSMRAGLEFQIKFNGVELPAPRQMIQNRNCSSFHTYLKDFVALQNLGHNKGVSLKKTVSFPK